MRINDFIFIFIFLTILSCLYLKDMVVMVGFEPEQSLILRLLISTAYSLLLVIWGVLRIAEITLNRT